MSKLVFDGKDAIFGRMATRIAKELLKGNSVDVLNSQDVIFSGKKQNIVDRLRQKRKMGRGGSLKGPSYSARSDLLLKRMIRGMLPWDKPKGREAYKRLRCYSADKSVTDDEKKNIITMNHRKPLIFTKLNDVVKDLK